MTKDAFIREVREAEAMLYHVSKSILKNDSDCGDAVQETLLKAYEKLPTLKREKFFRTWIIRILINECKGILQRRKNVIPYEDYMDNARMFEENRYDHLYYDSDYDLSNKTVEITLKNLTDEGDYNKTVITDGTWDFKWTLGTVKSPTTLDVNRKCDFGGYEITVKKMEVTPLLWSMYLDYDEAMKVYEDEKNKFEYAGTDYGMDLYDRTNIDQVCYKDGMVVTLDLTMGGIAGGGEKQDKENGVLIIRNSFPQLVDVDNLQAVHFGNIDQWFKVREQEMV